MKNTFMFTIILLWCSVAVATASVPLTARGELQPPPRKVEEYPLYPRYAATLPELQLLDESEDAFTLGEQLMDIDMVDAAEQEFLYSLECFFFSGIDFDNNELARARFFELLQRAQAYGDRLTMLAPPDDDDSPAEPHDEAPIDEMVDENLIPAKVDPAIAHRIEDDVLKQKYDFPIYVNKEVLSYIQYLTTGKKRELVALGLNRLGRYHEMFSRIFREEGLPQDLIYFGLIESNYSTRAYSRAKAKGMWQFISWTGRKYGLRVDWWVDERSDPEKSTRAACRYIKDLYGMFNDWYLVLAAYNSGEGRISRMLKRYPDFDYWDFCRKRKLPRETRGYVPAILAAIIVGRNPELFGFKIDPAEPLKQITVDIPSPSDLRVIADTIGVDFDTLKELNPSLRRMVTPADSDAWPIHVPADTSLEVIAQLNDLPLHDRLKWIEHRINRGDTLWDIARKYDVSVSAVKDYNHLRGRNPILRVGQVLLVPLSNMQRDPGEILNDDPRPARIAGQTYRVRRGDTLWGIARRCRASVTDLKSWNNLSSSQLSVGTVLRVTGGGGTAAPRAAVNAPAVRHSGNYIVQSGDTLWGISRKFNVSLPTLRRANNLSSHSRINPGQTLVIPGANAKRVAARHHVVRRGETLYGIARRYRTSVNILKQVNSLDDNQIHPGDRLVIPN